MRIRYKDDRKQTKNESYCTANEHELKKKTGETRNTIKIEFERKWENGAHNHCLGHSIINKY